MNINMITFINVKSALVSSAIAALISVGLFVVDNGSVFSLDWHLVANVGIITFVASLVKALGTTVSPHGSVPKGTFAGIQVR